MSVKHLSPLPSLGNIWKWTETFLSRRCMTLYNSAKHCSVIHKIELDLDISMIILYISSVNATSVKKMWRKWTKTVNIWNFISPWDITVENCLVVPKIKLDIMVNLFQNLLSVSETSAKKWKLQIIGMVPPVRGITLSIIDQSYPKIELYLDIIMINL